MEEYLADELTRLGISDADTFTGYVNGMLDGNDPVASPAEARESLTEAIEYINTLCGEASVAIAVASNCGPADRPRSWSEPANLPQ